jgi:hypothetical protein
MTPETIDPIHWLFPAAIVFVMLSLFILIQVSKL